MEQQSCVAESFAQTTMNMATRPSVRDGVLASIAVSIAVLLIATFELSMADWPSGVVVLVVLPLTALVFIGCCLWSATQLLRIRSDGVRFAAPFLICMLTLAILLYAPLQQVYLQQNFHWYRADRERIVARVERGELKPNVDYNLRIRRQAAEPARSI